MQEIWYASTNKIKKKWLHCKKNIEFAESEVSFKSFVTYIKKLNSFFNICSGDIIQSVVERFFE